MQTSSMSSRCKHSKSIRACQQLSARKCLNRCKHQTLSYKWASSRTQSRLNCFRIQMSIHSYSNKAITNSRVLMGKSTHREADLNQVLLCLNLRSAKGRLRNRINISRCRWNCQRCQANSRTTVKGRSVCLVVKWFICSHHSRILSRPSNNFLSTLSLISKWLNFKVSIISLKQCSNPNSKPNTCHLCRFWTTENLRMVSTTRAKARLFRTRTTQYWILSLWMAKSSSMATCTIKLLMESIMVVLEWCHLQWWPTNRLVRSLNLISSKLSVRCSHSTTKIEAFRLICIYLRLDVWKKQFVNF